MHRRGPAACCKCKTGAGPGLQACLDLLTERAAGHRGAGTAPSWPSLPEGHSMHSTPAGPAGRPPLPRRHPARPRCRGPHPRPRSSARPSGACPGHGARCRSGPERRRPAGCRRAGRCPCAGRHPRLARSPPSLLTQSTRRRSRSVGMGTHRRVSMRTQEAEQEQAWPAPQGSGKQQAAGQRAESPAGHRPAEGCRSWAHPPPAGDWAAVSFPEHPPLPCRQHPRRPSQSPTTTGLQGC